MQPQALATHTAPTHHLISACPIPLRQNSLKSSRKLSEQRKVLSVNLTIKGWPLVGVVVYISNQTYQKRRTVWPSDYFFVVVEKDSESWNSTAFIAPEMVLPIQ